MSNYLVRLSGRVRQKSDPDGRHVDGEYGSFTTVPAATREAKDFAARTVGGRISVYRITKEGGIRWVKDVRS